MSSPADVAILVPLLHRPWRVGPLLGSITATTTVPHQVVFACTPNDLATIDAVRAEGHEPLLVEWRHRGDYARKVQAGIDTTTTPYVFTGADDLKFHPRWFENAAKHMDGTVGVVGTNDLCSARVIAGEHGTHFLVARWYIAHGTVDQPGQLFHDGYVHEFVDDELVGTAKQRGAWAFAHDSIVEHLHPMAGKAPMDKLYAAQKSRMGRSRALYLRRRSLWTSPSP